MLAAKPGLRAKLGLGPRATLSYAVGDRIDVPASVYDAAPVTILLFARSTCGVCQRAAPTFAAMFGSARANPRSSIRLISNGASHEDEVSYAHRVGLGEADMRAVDVTPLRLRLVPTLVLLDRQGTVRYASEGVPTAAQQDEFARVLKTMAAR